MPQRRQTGKSRRKVPPAYCYCSRRLALASGASVRISLRGDSRQTVYAEHGKEYWRPWMLGNQRPDKSNDKLRSHSLSRAQPHIEPSWVSQEKRGMGVPSRLGVPPPSRNRHVSFYQMMKTCFPLFITRQLHLS